MEADFGGIGDRAEANDLVNESGHAGQINYFPTVGNDSFNSLPDIALEILSEKLILNDSDPDSDPLRVIAVGVSPNTVGTIEPTPNGAIYHPPGDFVGDDELFYVIADSRDGVASGVIIIHLAKAVPQVTWTRPADITYGTSLGPEQLNASASVPGSFSYEPPSGTILPASHDQLLQVTFTPSDSANYASAIVNVLISVKRAPLTVTANDFSKVYGASLPVLTASYDGFVNGDTSSDLTSPVTLSTTAMASSPAGTYPITPSGAASPNYEITFTPGVLTVTSKLLPVITWNNPSDITYGAALGLAQLNATASVPGSFSYSPAAGTVLAAGSGQLLRVTFTPTDSVSYSSTTASVLLNVKRAALTVTANDFSKVYGASLPLLTASYAGFVNNDTAASLTTPVSLTTAASASSPARTYPIIPSGASSPNYEIAFVSGTLVVTKAPLHIIAGDRSKIEGAVLPTLTARYGGFVNGDTSSDLTSPVTLSTTATASSPAGTYPITPSGAASPNYEITFTPGVLTVTSKLLPVITWNNPADITYGAALSAAQLDASASVPGSFSYTPAAGTVLAAGSGQLLWVTFTPTDTVSYSSTTASVLLNVKRAALTVTANDLSKVYGAALPGLTVSYAGFVNNDTAASLATPVSLSTAASASSPAGTYPIVPSGASSPNYEITFVSGALVITKAPLNIIAEDKSKIEGGVLPTLTARYVGFVNGDSSASLTSPPTLTTTAIASSSAGTYPITASGAASPNYEITFTPGVLTVTSKLLPVITWNNPADITYGAALGAAELNATASVPGAFSYAPAAGTVLAAGSGQLLRVTFTPTDTVSYSSTTASVLLNVKHATLTVTANDLSKVYGASLPGLTASYAGFVNNDTATSLAAPVSLSSAASASSPAGTYPIVPSGASSPNYEITFVSGALVVTKAPLNVIAEDKSKIAGAALPTLTARYVGFVNGDTSASLTSPLTLTTTATASSPVGTYPITAGGAASPNYAITFTPGTLTVTSKLLPVITWNSPADIIYGAALGTAQLNASASVPGSFSFSPAAGTVLAAGSGQLLRVTFTPSDSVSYSSTTASVLLNVKRAALTVAANDLSKVYGASLPGLTASYAGFVNNDTATSLAAPVSVSTAVSASSPAGTYPIVPTGASSPNYDITFVSGALVVTKAPLNIIAEDKSKFEGAALPALTVRYDGFVNGDTSSDLPSPVTLTTPATASSPAGTYSITPSGAVSPNYEITFNPGVLTVTSKLLPVITWNSPADINYGAALGAVQLNASASVPGSFSYAPAAGTVLAAGSGHLLRVTFNPSDTVSYSSTTASVLLNVKRAALTVTANNLSKLYGAALPVLIASYAGFVNNDTAASLATPVSLSTAASASSPAGTYPTVPSGASSPNYDIAFVSGTLVVTKAPLTIVAEDKSKRVGDPLPQLTAAYLGFVNGDTSASLTSPVTLTSTATASSPAGTYPITPSGPASPNYEITFTPGVLTVTSKLLPVITWNNPADVTYGAALGAAELNAAASVPGAFSYTPAAGTALAAGSGQLLRVTFTPTDTVSYSSTTASVLLNVKRAALTVTANDLSKLYGAALPNLTASYTGFVNNDTAASLATPVSLSTAASASSPAGTYPIVPSGASSPNYDITFVAGALVVTRAPLTIVAEDKSKRVGDPLPQLTAAYLGFVNGDTSADLTSAVMLTTTATASSPAGTYPITSAGAASPNYDITFRSGLLTVATELMTLTGSAFDGYIAGATVFFDANMNGAIDPGEPLDKTDRAGRFTNLVVSLDRVDRNGNRTIDPNEGRIVVIGGRDILTGMPLDFALASPASFRVVSPVTTLLVRLDESDPGLGVAGAAARILTAFNLPPQLDLATYDPFARQSDPGALQVAKASAEIETVTRQIGSLLSARLGQPKDRLTESAFRALAAEIKDSPNTRLLLGETNLTARLIQKIQAASSSLVDSESNNRLISSAAAIIAQSGLALEVIAATNGTISTLAKVQVAIHSRVLYDLEQMGNGSLDPDEALIANAGAKFAAAIKSAPVGDLMGTSQFAGTFAFSAVEFRVPEGAAWSSIRPSIVRTGGSFGVANLLITLVDGSATLVANDIRTNRLQITFQDGEIQKTISLDDVIVDDALREGNERFTLVLAPGTGFPLTASVGSPSSALVTVIDDDSIDRQIVITRVGNEIQLDWPDLPPQLQAAPSPHGPWKSVVGARPPHIFPAQGNYKFFRVRSEFSSVTLNISRVGSDIELDWLADSIQLLESNFVNGPWQSVPGPVSRPFKIDPTGTARFFRVE